MASRFEENPQTSYEGYQDPTLRAIKRMYLLRVQRRFVFIHDVLYY
jgi:hypothetical protein